jgi:hypothetical protein
MAERKWKLDEIPVTGLDMEVYSIELLPKEIPAGSISVISDLATARKVAAFEEMYQALKLADELIEQLYNVCEEEGGLERIGKIEQVEKIEAAMRLADTGKE